MTRIRTDQPLTPSVLDRLIDREPGNTREVPKSSTQVLAELKQSVRRDLENLLNTRWRATHLPADLDELEFSLANYGIPDISGASLALPIDRERFRRVVEMVIRHFEPRFKEVSVEMLDELETLDRTLRFRIDALLYADPVPEPVVFDSALEPATGNIAVHGAGGSGAGKWEKSR